MNKALTSENVSLVVRQTARARFLLIRYSSLEQLGSTDSLKYDLMVD